MVHVMKMMEAVDENERYTSREYHRRPPIPWIVVIHRSRAQGQRGGIVFDDLPAAVRLQARAAADLLHDAVDFRLTHDKTARRSVVHRRVRVRLRLGGRRANGTQTQTHYAGIQPNAELMKSKHDFAASTRRRCDSQKAYRHREDPVGLPRTGPCRSGAHPRRNSMVLQRVNEAPRDAIPTAARERQAFLLPRVAARSCGRRFTCPSPVLAVRLALLPGLRLAA